MGYFWKIKKCEKEGSVLNIIIPPANTHSDVAKEQHLVPRTYKTFQMYYLLLGVCLIPEDKEDLLCFEEKSVKKIGKIF